MRSILGLTHEERVDAIMELCGQAQSIRQRADSTWSAQECDIVRRAEGVERLFDIARERRDRGEQPQ